MRSSASETVSIQELVSTLRRGRRWLLYGVAAGLLIALVMSLALPPRYEADGTVVLRDRTEGASSPGVGLASMGEELGEIFSSLPSLPGSLGSDLDTEFEVLRSRDILRRTVEDVGLTVRVTRPRETPIHDIFSSVEAPAWLKEPVRVRARRQDDGSYRFDAPEGDVVVGPGGTATVAGATLTLRRDGDLPDAFTIEVMDVQDAIRRIDEKRLFDAELLGGDVAEVTFVAAESETAARTVNRLVSLYLEDRQERLNSLRRERIEVLASVSDSLRGELTASTDAYRRHLETRGRFEPESLGDLERVAMLQAEMDALEVEAGAMDELLRVARSEDMRPEDLAGIPGLAENEALGRLMDRLHQAWTERQARLAWLTEEDPEVRALEANIDYLQGQLVSTARSYRQGVHRRLDQMSSEIARYRDRLASRPLEEEQDFVLETDVERLMGSFLGIQAQIVQERLAAIAEGRDLRQVDVAFPPKEPEFPKLPLNLALGFLGGLLVGGVGALAGGTLTRRVTDPAQIETVLGIPSLLLGDDALLMGGIDDAGVVLVVAVADSRGAGKVARRLAETASLRTSRAALLDLSEGGMPGLPPLLPERFRETRSSGGGHYHVLPDPGGNGGPPGGGEGLSPAEAGDAVQRMRDHLSPIFIALPDPSHPLVAALAHSSRPVVLVARVGSAAMEDLRETDRALSRLGVPVLGVVLHRD